MKNLPLVALGLVLVAGGCAPRLGAELKPGKWGYVGGMTVRRPDTDVKGTEDEEIYLNERYSLSAYRIEVPRGTYVVKLHFAETYEGITSVGGRVFTVSLEGKPVLKDLDVFKEAGESRYVAVVKRAVAKVADGELTIEFTPKTQNPMINGIEVFRRSGCPVLPTLRPVVRINCGATEDYRDKAGNLWHKDQPYQP